MRADKVDDEDEGQVWEKSDRRIDPIEQVHHYPDPWAAWYMDLFPNSSQQGEESDHRSTSGQLPRELADRTQFKSAPSRAVFSIQLHVILP